MKIFPEESNVVVALLAGCYFEMSGRRRCRAKPRVARDRLPRAKPIGRESMGWARERKPKCRAENVSLMLLASSRYFCELSHFLRANPLPARRRINILQITANVRARSLRSVVSIVFRIHPLSLSNSDQRTKMLKAVNKTLNNFPGRNKLYNFSANDCFVQCRSISPSFNSTRSEKYRKIFVGFF